MTVAQPSRKVQTTPPFVSSAIPLHFFLFSALFVYTVLVFYADNYTCKMYQIPKVPTMHMSSELNFFYYNLIVQSNFLDLL